MTYSSSEAVYVVVKSFLQELLPVLHKACHGYLIFLYLGRQSTEMSTDRMERGRRGRIKEGREERG